MADRARRCGQRRVGASPGKRTWLPRRTPPGSPSSASPAQPSRSSTYSSGVATPSARNAASLSAASSAPESWIPGRPPRSWAHPPPATCHICAGSRGTARAKRPREAERGVGRGNAGRRVEAVASPERAKRATHKARGAMGRQASNPGSEMRSKKWSKKPPRLLGGGISKVTLGRKIFQKSICDVKMAQITTNGSNASHEIHKEGGLMVKNRKVSSLFRSSFSSHGCDARGTPRALARVSTRNRRRGSAIARGRRRRQGERTEGLILA